MVVSLANWAFLPQPVFPEREEIMLSQELKIRKDQEAIPEEGRKDPSVRITASKGGVGLSLLENSEGG